MFFFMHINIEIRQMNKGRSLFYLPNTVESNRISPNGMRARYGL